MKLLMANGEESNKKNVYRNPHFFRCLWTFLKESLRNSTFSNNLWPTALKPWKSYLGQKLMQLERKFGSTQCICMSWAVCISTLGSVPNFDRSFSVSLASSGSSYSLRCSPWLGLFLSLLSTSSLLPPLQLSSLSVKFLELKSPLTVAFTALQSQL